MMSAYLSNLLGMFLCMTASAALTAEKTVAPSTGEDVMMELIFRFGALGLCGYMVFQNYRSSQRMETRFDKRQQNLLEVIEKQQAVIEEKNREVKTLHEETLNVIRKCTGRA